MPLLDEYQMPNVDLDPQEMERLRAMAMMRLGFGMAGREPIGSAMQAGINTMFAGQEDARRQALAKAKLAMEQQKYAATARKQAELQELADRLDPNQMLAAGISQNELNYARKNPEYLPELFKKIAPMKLGQGDNIYVPGVGFIDQAPDKDGMVTVFDGAGRPVGRRELTGQTEAMARRAAAVKAAEQSQTFMQLGVDQKGRPQYGFPTPPAMRQQVPVRTNFSGTPEQQAEAQAMMQRDLAQRGMTPQNITSIGPSPTEEALTKARGESGIKGWEKLQEEAYTKASFAQSMRANMGAMRDILDKSDKDMPTGALAPFTLAARQFGSSLGLATQGTAPAELFKSITTQTALAVRNPGSGMGLPGAASDRDMAMLESASPTLAQSSAGRRLLVETWDAMGEMAQKKAELISEMNIKVSKGQMSEAEAQREVIKSLHPNALAATAKIKEAIAEAGRLESENEKNVTGATAAPSTQNALRLRELNQREEEIRRRLGQRP